MRIPFFLFLTTFYAASGVLARGPGVVTLPEKCNCPVGSICPVTDGCYIQGKKEAAAEADRRCSASVEAARAEEQAKCDAKVLQEKTSCDSKMSEAETRCNEKVSEEKSRCDAKISEGKTECDNKISQVETSCNAKISEKENSCKAKISEEKSNCDTRVRTAGAENLGELKVCRGAIELCQTQLDQCQKPPSCGVDKWGQGWYDVKINVNLVNCQNICKADPKCLSFSDSKLTTGPQNCYLYDKETARVPHGTYAGWVQYDKRCGPVPNIPSPPSCGVEIWGQGWYSVRTGVNLANCKSLCFADSRCLSYSANKFNTGAYINCYLYDKETAALVPGKWENWIQYDKRCG
ncbi:PAn-2 domain-containing protein [Fusarium mundagurra]|uniref:PAn-2 domain-containing protein n=1 Tax=Fusarium mundagurra TaxID=1567541 RepID=A0A8H5XQV3_9HYPO|nr:PAn-2 domain-containing protein [Fusarium mundagurra]